MKTEAAILFVQGMVKSVRPQPRDDEANAWKKRVGWFVILEDSPNGEPQDHREHDWTVQVERLPELIEAARMDGAAYDVAQKLACAYLRWNRPLPEALARHVISRLTGGVRKPHRKISANLARDEMAVVSIKYLQQVAGIVPDRNDASASRPSGIQIVTDALRDAGYTATYSAIKTAFYRNRDAV